MPPFLLPLLMTAGSPSRSLMPVSATPSSGPTCPAGGTPTSGTMRAMVVNADGSGRRELAPALARQPDSWTQFAGWSPDGRTAILGRGWQNPENAKWEEEHKQFRFTKEGYLLDTHLFDMKTGRATNVTAVERVSFYNAGVFFWPNDPTNSASRR